MKNNHKIAVVLLLILAFFNACKNENLETDTFKIERERVVPSIDSVSITGSFSFAGTVKGMRVNIGEKESLIDANTYEMMLEGTDFFVGIGSLKPSTEYFYRYTIDFGTNDELLTETKSFTTLDVVAEAPTVKIYQYPLFDEDSTFVRVKCEVITDGGAEVSERGIFWNNLGDPVEGDSIMQHANGGLGIYTINMEHLTLGKTYYVRAYARNTAGVGLSDDVLEIKTNAPLGTSVDIELSCNPLEGGTASGGGTYEAGTQCTVTATANTGYTFINWTENGEQVSSEAVYTFAVTTSRSLVANFTKQAYVITTEVDPEDSGSVTGAGGYDYGESCTLTATPKTGYEFEKWTKGSSTVSSNTVSTDAEYTFTVTGSASYVAHFKTKSYTVSVAADPENGGTVDGGGTYNFGQSCSVHAAPADGFLFNGWTDEGDVVSTETDFTFTVTGDRSLVAVFTAEPPEEYTITTNVTPSGSGTVTGGGVFYDGDNCTVIATANNGYAFSNWTENGDVVSTNATYSFEVHGNRTLVANFTQQAPQTYTITVSANPTNGGRAYIGSNMSTTQSTFNNGQYCTIHATASTGYIFTKWTENGSLITTSASYSFTVTSDRTLVANFITAPTGALNGLFSVSPTQQVWFSRGNLQYQASTSSWRFAIHQYDYIGNDNSNISSTYTGWIDLFGWGTSGYSHGAVCYQAYSASTINSEYNPYGGDTYNLYDQSGKADWGFNAITNGGCTYNKWRTLTENEWDYVFNTRQTASGIRYAKAQVNGVKGVILLPNNWSASYYRLNETNNSGASSSANVISSSIWTNNLESHGAVFLPYAGYRHGTSIHNVGSYGLYWSTSYSNSTRAYDLYFHDSNLYPSHDNYRNYGHSVRLVHSAQ